MAIVIRISFLLMMLYTGFTKEWTQEIYPEGTNVTVRIDELQINGDRVLEINFSGFFSKLQISNVVLYDQRMIQFDSQSVNRNYIGRIRNIKMNNGSLSFLLLNVNFMDSGNYTAFEDSLEKGKMSILVPRRIPLGQNVASVILPFMCNITNISWITIEIVNPTHLPILNYDVKQEKCTEFGDLYIDRIESCVLNGNRLSFTLQNVTWLDKGTYVAWDDKRFLLDSVDLDIQEGITMQSLKATQEYATLPSTAKAPLDSLKIVNENNLNLTTRVEGHNANMITDGSQTDGNCILEINLYGYSSKLHVTNVMLANPKEGQHDGGSVSRNYTGQIQMIVMSNASLGFQLLKVALEGTKEFKYSFEKRIANIIVQRSRLAQDGESGIRSLMCNKTVISLNKSDMMQTDVTSTVIIYNVTLGNYTYVAQNYSARIRSCVASGNNVSFIFQEAPWLEKATFAACDDKGFILNSITIEIQGSSLETTNESDTLSFGTSITHDSSSTSEKSQWFLTSAVVIAVVAICLAMFAFRKFRQRRVPTSDTDIVTYRNRAITSVNGSHHSYPRHSYTNVKETDASEESTMFLAKKKPSENVTDITNNKDQAQIRPKHTNKLSTESIADPCLEYDYVVQHSFMTLRPPAPDPVVTGKTKEQVASAESISWYKRVNNGSLSTVYPSFLYANANKKRTGGRHYTVSRLELGGRNFINHPPSYLDLEYIHATSITTSSCCLSYGGGRNMGMAENLNSKELATRQEFSAL